MADSDATDVFDPTSVNLTEADPADIICFLNASSNEYDGRLGLRVSAVFVILVASTAGTVFPLLASRVSWLRTRLYFYLFARYFGAGVIIATAFIHLLDPAYDEIGPASCVGMTGGWAGYSWPPAIAMTAVMVTFLLDFGAEWYVEGRYGLPHAAAHGGTERAVTAPAEDATDRHQYLHSADQDLDNTISSKPPVITGGKSDGDADAEGGHYDKEGIERAFHQQFAAFLILEFGVIFHSVIIGLNLGVAGDEFDTLYPVIVFHQAFEGLGIGARLCVIPFPRPVSWLPWALCALYGLTTPIAIAIGIGLSTTYDGGSFTAQVVSGVLDSISAGILLYTGLVELLARDFLFNPERTRDRTRICFMLFCLFLGVLLMALLGKWA